MKRVVELDNNDEDYISILREPFILNNDIISGAYPFWGVALAYNLLRSRSPATKGNSGVVAVSLGQSQGGSKAGHIAPEDILPLPNTPCPAMWEEVVGTNIPAQTQPSPSASRDRMTITSEFMIALGCCSGYCSASLIRYCCPSLLWL